MSTCQNFSGVILPTPQTPHVDPSTGVGTAFETHDACQLRASADRYTSRDPHTLSSVVLYIATLSSVSRLASRVLAALVLVPVLHSPARGAKGIHSTGAFQESSPARYGPNLYRRCYLHVEAL